MRNPAISILLIVKNALPILTGALLSLQDQTFKGFEVVVVDGGSTDGTLDVLHEVAKLLPLRIMSEPDRSLADGFAKGLRRATSDIVGMLCADERYYSNTLEQVVRWFEANPDAVMCGGKLDFIDEQDKVTDSHLTEPFNLSAHLACELVPSNLSSFFNRRLIGADFRFDAEVPTCPDYEFWARLGFRFPPSAFKRYDVSVAQAYRTRASMSFRAESFRQMCTDKLTHLNNLVAKGYILDGNEVFRKRSAAGIHMWAAEQLAYIEHAHPDILAHCAAAAHYDPEYERIARFISITGKAHYDRATGTVTRTVPDQPSLQVMPVATLACANPPPYWPGAAILDREPLTIRTADSPWGFSAELTLTDRDAVRDLVGGQQWVRLDLEVLEGSIGISLLAPGQTLVGEQIFRQSDGRVVALIPLAAEMDPASPVMLRSGGQGSSVLRIHHADLLSEPNRSSATMAPIMLAL